MVKGWQAKKGEDSKRLGVAIRGGRLAFKVRSPVSLSGELILT